MAKAKPAKNKRTKKAEQYAPIIEKIFKDHHVEGAVSLDFDRSEIETAAAALEIALPKNVGDVIYSFRYRRELPEAIRTTCETDERWYIFPRGIAKYRFKKGPVVDLGPRTGLAEIKILDATPQIIDRHALKDEQALLAKVRYNRLIDIFTGVTAYSLQNHLRTTVADIGQVEVDELYLGVNREGQPSVIPVQAKGGRDKLGVVQVYQDDGMCREKFPQFRCRPISIQFVKKKTKKHEPVDQIIVMFELQLIDELPKIVRERHYKLVRKDEITNDELRELANRPIPED